MTNTREKGKATKGPWVIRTDRVSGAAWLEGEGRDICDFYSRIAGKPTRYDNWEANAHLIAAAPELMEACKAAIEGLREEARDNGGSATPRAYDAQLKLMAVVAKAEGRV